jgi:hypothetical protein
MSIRKITVTTPNKNTYICIHSKNYNSKLPYILSLVEEARKDFPFLTDQEVQLIHLGGRRYKGMFGIEFSVPSNTIIPNDYQQVLEPEPLLY